MEQKAEEGETTIFEIGFTLLFWALVIGGVIVGVNYIPKYEDRVLTDDVRIYSVHDGKTVSGSFFLGIGSIQDRMQYITYIDVGGGGTKLHSVPTEYTTIYEDEDVLPYLRTLHNYRVNLKTGEKSLSESFNGYPKYEFHVPKGTVKKEFVLDGE